MSQQWSSNAIRSAFLEYFQEHGHTLVSSSSLVPSNDPTLLFTNAGMVQFKEVFLGLEERNYSRAVSSQRCVRAGGKHNDLENVGYTARHHTFFEMLGNFSFGDYFKHETIRYAWDFLTNVLGLPEDKLWVTVYEDDDEAANIWLEDLQVSPERFSRCGEKDNFWSMGDTGPCGPCSEIFYDHGPEVAGGPPGSPEADGDRYIEIWNLVFTQFDRDSQGHLHPIPKPSVDTGMGLERIAAVMQGVHNNYDIDLFQHLIKAIDALGAGDTDNQISRQVIADHIRSVAFLITDGVLPSNENRGYVLRRILRRAIRHGHKLGLRGPFFHKLVGPLGEKMGDAYQELLKKREAIEKIILQEEKRFAETLDQGLKLLEETVARLDGTEIPGEAVFKLYDTYGFPIDLTADIARERGLTIDNDGFRAAMDAQRARGRAASRFQMDMSKFPKIDKVTEFTGYDQTEQQTEIIALYREGKTVNQLEAGEFGGVVLAATPFYAESGGQVGDRGQLRADGGEFAVSDTQKQSKAHIHLGEVGSGRLEVGQRVHAAIDAQARADTMRNHSATHLLHAALRKVLGDHVTQKGSLVAPERLRFDFSHPQALSDDEIQEIEWLVNAQILNNVETDIQVMPLEQALEDGAMSLFGEKYDDQVRVLKIGGEFSKELCGGTHVARTGDIGLFKIVAVAGIAAGVRRIEAVTGRGALHWANQSERRLGRVADLLRAEPDYIEDKLAQFLERNRKLEKEVEQLKSKLASSAGDDLLAAAVDIDGLKVLARSLEGADPKTLRETVDQLKNKLGSAALVLATVQESKVSLVAGVTKDHADRVNAGELVNFVAAQVGGKGGGRPDMAQAGGNDPSQLQAALDQVPDWVRARV
ncbi:alanyl-tRNA synthetase [Methylohalomonas lacus]|uniref:Alanine--tRNA ligase n=1 Tax=Methylohalomonas lacus TaxID=398773 RepID=A0AAE3HKX8_9GAMM|nr:alanine--tRNA ligase [Methylohalomonas lacus]MCS3903123.1 alanyl-tRNA synthetase [Methylohalomonas lacus]